jgi:hypothetical protein
MGKANIEKSIAANWDELFAMINEYFADWPAYIFRGHAQSDWLLESTLTRALKKKAKDNDPLFKDYLVKEHLEMFNIEVRGRRGLNPQKLSENELWALGQHFGLYTPLLDWTHSPYVALFFALTSQEKSSTGLRTLWALLSSDIEDISEWYKNEKSSFSNLTVGLINPILDENSRLVNQNGLFTKLSIENDIEKWVLHGPEFNWVTLIKIDFPERIRAKALSFLNLMNINYSSLFPDLFGSSMNCNVTFEQTDCILQQQAELRKQSDKK